MGKHWAETWLVPMKYPVHAAAEYGIHAGDDFIDGPGRESRVITVALLDAVVHDIGQPWLGRLLRGTTSAPPACHPFRVGAERRDG